MKYRILIPRVMRREMIARIVMLRGLGFSTKEIGGMVSKERQYSQSSISKQLRRVRNSILSGRPEGKAIGDPPKDVFKQHLFFLEDLDSDDLVALGSKKYDYIDLTVRCEVPEIEALRMVFPECTRELQPYYRLNEENV